MKTASEIVSGTYYDSMQLMRVVSDVQASTPVADADAVMGTAANLDRLENGDTIDPAELDGVEPDDLVLVARAPDAADAEAAVEAMRAALATGTDSDRAAAEQQVPPKSISGVCKAAPETDIALISVPGEYAGLEAWNALHEDLHVHLFSDNVPVDTEQALKQFAHDTGQLLMGPDCGTAIVDGLPLGFANEVPIGSIGLVAASGTGLQAVTSRLGRRGVGISQAIGTGGRDLSNEVEGLGTRTALAKLDDDDDATDVIVLLSKAPDGAAVRAVSEMISDCSTPMVVHFQGAESAPEGVATADTLAATADRAIEVAEVDAEPLSADTETTLDLEQSGWIRGLFTGGTLCAEAARLAAREHSRIRSNVGVGEEIDSSESPAAHTFVDFGADQFTEGRPHPMIDPTIRNERLEAVLTAPDTGAVLLDVVLGYGSHEDPAGTVADVVATTDSDVPVVASVCGTDADVQPRHEQVAKLEAAGVHVTQSNAAAARLVSRQPALHGPDRVEGGSA